MRTRRKMSPAFRVLAGVVSLAALLAVAGCGRKDAETIKIGHAGPLTGPLAHYGKDNENGVRLALDDANAEPVVLGGRKVTFVMLSEDDQADPKQSTIVAQKLVDAHVAGVIGHLNSGTSIPASKIYNDGGVPEISPSATNPNYTHQGFKNVFRVTANDAQQGKVLGEYAVAKLGAKSIAIVDDRSAYGQGLADEFEKAAKAAGGTIVAHEFTGMDKTDFNAILTTVKGRNPDLIFYGGNDVQAGRHRVDVSVRRWIPITGIPEARRTRRRGRLRVAARRTVGKDAGRRDVCREVQSQIQRRDPALGAIRVRRGSGNGGSDENCGFG